MREIRDEIRARVIREGGRETMMTTDNKKESTCRAVQSEAVKYDGMKACSAVPYSAAKILGHSIRCNKCNRHSALSHTLLSSILYYSTLFSSHSSSPLLLISYHIISYHIMLSFLLTSLHFTSLHLLLCVSVSAAHLARPAQSSSSLGLLTLRERERGREEREGGGEQEKERGEGGTKKNQYKIENVWNLSMNKNGRKGEKGCTGTHTGTQKRTHT